VDDRLNHVLDAIDGALVDDELGPDAMRWNPDPEAANPDRGDPYGDYYGPVAVTPVVEAAMGRLRAAWEQYSSAAERQAYRTPIVQHHTGTPHHTAYRVDWSRAYIQAPPRPDRPGWLAGLRIVEDEGLARDDVHITVAVEREQFRDGDYFYRPSITSRTAEAHIPAGLDEVAREALVRQIAATYNLPVCVIDGHRWGEEAQGWTWNAERNAMVRPCGRCDCTALDVRPGRRR
jgi:hypothetical protein